MLALVAACAMYLIVNAETDQQAAMRLDAETRALDEQNDRLERRLQEAGVDVDGAGSSAAK